jgi:hypothetical protein
MCSIPINSRSKRANIDKMTERRWVVRHGRVIRALILSEMTGDRVLPELRDFFRMLPEGEVVCPARVGADTRVAPTSPK